MGVKATNMKQQNKITRCNRREKETRPTVTRGVDSPRTLQKARCGDS